jgi:hypothetical protein
LSTIPAGLGGECIISSPPINWWAIVNNPCGIRKMESIKGSIRIINRKELIAKGIKKSTKELMGYHHQIPAEFDI